MRSNTVSTILSDAFGSWEYLGTIAGDGSVAKTSQSTAAPFTIPAGSHLVLQPDVSVFALPTPKQNADGTTTAQTASSTNGLKLAASAERDLTLRSFQSDVSIISVSGSFNVKVFRQV